MSRPTLEELDRDYYDAPPHSGSYGARDYGPNGSANATKPRTLDVIWADDIEIDLDQSGLVEDLLPLTGMSVAYGESGCGKTFVALDIACHVATGTAWRARAVEQGIVVYIAAEAPRSVERRVWAWKRYHDVTHLPLIVVRSSVDLLTTDTASVLALIDEIQAQHGTIALVCIDTLARAMQGNENSPEDMGAFVAACGSIREASGAHVMIVHHTGKELAKGARGHSSLRAATDVELELSNPPETGGTIRVTKSRDGESGITIGFKLDVFELGETPRGKTVTTCVAIEAEPQSPREKARRVGKNEKIVLDALTAAISDRSETPPRSPDIPPGVRGVSVDTWGEYAVRYLPHPIPKRRDEAFSRAMVSLVSDNFVRHAAGFVWLSDH